jgi:hypothetical protein
MGSLDDNRAIYPGPKFTGWPEPPAFHISLFSTTLVPDRQIQAALNTTFDEDCIVTNQSHWSVEQAPWHAEIRRVGEVITEHDDEGLATATLGRRPTHCLDVSVWNDEIPASAVQATSWAELNEFAGCIGHNCDIAWLSDDSAQMRYKIGHSGVNVLNSAKPPAIATLVTADEITEREVTDLMPAGTIRDSDGTWRLKRGTWSLMAEIVYANADIAICPCPDEHDDDLGGEPKSALSFLLTGNRAWDEFYDFAKRLSNNRVVQISCVGEHSDSAIVRHGEYLLAPHRKPRRGLLYFASTITPRDGPNSWFITTYERGAVLRCGALVFESRRPYNYCDARKPRSSEVLVSGLHIGPRRIRGSP